MVTDISEAEIVCLLFDENFGIISEVTHREQFVSSTNSAVMDQRRTMKNPSGPLHPFWWDCVTRILVLPRFFFYVQSLPASAHVLGRD
jgi:hypothetical protein